MVANKTSVYDFNLDFECSCGCKGWWDDCVKNKSNRDNFVLSAPPSPHRTNDDWFTQENNPIYIGPSTINIKTTVPSTSHRMSAKYISYCVDKYFSKEN
tara:strand:+ start:229 stop:525 length:297 start_codon:yes stop_codon:yes gene_type:complete